MLLPKPCGHSAAKGHALQCDSSAIARMRADCDHAYHADLPRWQELTSRLGLEFSLLRMNPSWPSQDVFLELTKCCRWLCEYPSVFTNCL